MHKLPRPTSRFPKWLARAAGALLAALLVPAAAHADASCQALVAAKISQIQASGIGIFYQLTRVGAGPTADVGYQNGELFIDGTYLEDVNSGNWDLSDRFSNGQPFDRKQAQSADVYVLPDGTLWIWSVTNNEWTVVGANLTCSGNTMTGVVNGNVYTLAFRTIQPPIG